MSQALSRPPFQFVHASDFHLERPLGGVAEVPEHLRELFLEAPFQAAEQVFETVLSEGVDALVLSGDILDVEAAGPRGVIFLRNHFQRLADHDVPVYWACGEVDPPDSWPASIELPENVHVFPVGRVEAIDHRREGEIVARIQGISRSQGSAWDDSGFHRDANGHFTVGVAYRTTASPDAEGDRVHYMALGGQHRRQTVDQSLGIVHYAGSPQGRAPSETDACGCTIVAVDETGHVKTTFIATDAARWITETMEVTTGTDEDALLAQMESRIGKLQIKHHDSHLFITWHIEGHGQVLNHIRSGGISDQMVALLREQYGQRERIVWTVCMESVAPLDVPQEWVDQETIMGDMLREFRTLETDETIALGLEEFMPEQLRGGPWEELSEVREEDRAGLLWAASKMSVDLLDGERKN